MGTPACRAVHKDRTCGVKDGPAAPEEPTVRFARTDGTPYVPEHDHHDAGHTHVHAHRLEQLMAGPLGGAGQSPRLQATGRCPRRRPRRWR